MALDYFNQVKNRRRSSQIMQTPNPVLSSEDEAFLQQVTSQQENIPSSAGPSDEKAVDSTAESPAHFALSEPAQDVPLPTSPTEEFGKELGEEARENPELVETKSEPPKPEGTRASDKKKKRWLSTLWKKDPDSKKVCISLRTEYPQNTNEYLDSRKRVPAKKTNPSPIYLPRRRPPPTEPEKKPRRTRKT